MVLEYRYPTRVGLAQIVKVRDRWRIRLSGEDLGGYLTPQQALDDFVGGHTFSHSSGADTSTLGLPDELLDWESVRAN